MKEKVIFIPCLLCTVACIFQLIIVLASETSGGQQLKFRADGTFTIIQFTDLHYGDTEGKDPLTTKTQNKILDTEDADLVVLSGDAVSGFNYNGTKGWFAGLWPKVVQPMIDHNIRWAFTFGNHDDQGDLSRTEIVQLDQQYNLSLTQIGPADIHGVTNYFLPIQRSTGLFGDSSANIWFLDSGDNDCMGAKGWGCINPDAVEWYRDTAVKNQWKERRDTPIPSIMYFHIPLPEWLNLYNYYEVRGEKWESVCCSSLNSGLFTAIKSAGDTRWVSVGHDHMNDYYGDYYGVTLTYGRKTGYGAHGPAIGTKKGARVLRLHENPFSIETWIRNEEGEREPEQPIHHPWEWLSMQHVCHGAVGGPSDGLKHPGKREE